MSATAPGEDFFPFNEVGLKSGKTLADSDITTTSSKGRVGGMSFGNFGKNSAVGSKVAIASTGSTTIMPPSPIFSFLDFGNKKEVILTPIAMAALEAEESKSSGFSFPNPFASLFGGSNLKDPKKSADGKNFFDVQTTNISGKKVKMGQLCKGKKAILVVNVASA